MQLNLLVAFWIVWNLDQLIGRNVAAFRGERSQADVAAAMKARGWKWSQATVWSVEKGERPLRLAEAEDLADILGRKAFEFTDTAEQVTFKRTMTELYQASTQLEKAVGFYLAAADNFADAADGDDIPPALHEPIRSMLARTPVTVARDPEVRQMLVPPVDSAAEGTYMRFLLEKLAEDGIVDEDDG